LQSQDTGTSLLPMLEKSSTNPRRNFELDRFNIVSWASSYTTT